MSPVIRATTATLAALNTISSLSGGSNGPVVSDFNNKSVNILPPLPGPNKAGVVTLHVEDVDRHDLPLCDLGNNQIPNVFCKRPRKITASLYYPACPRPWENQPEPVLLDEHHFAPVFPPSILANISQGVADGSSALHNLMSQAVDEAPACRGQYPMVIFAPTAGGQRQAYTQAASELASLGHVVVTVDYPYLSGAVKQADGNVHLSTFGHWIDTREALSIQANDVQYVLSHLVTEEQPLSYLPSWTNETTVQLDACVFGHGSGGQVAQMMVDTQFIKCGGPLEGVLTLPAPFNKEETTAVSKPTVKDPRPGVPLKFPLKGAHFALPTKHRMIQVLKDLRATGTNAMAQFICRITSTCEKPIQKRNVGDDPWFPPKKPYYKNPCDNAYGYKHDKDEHKHCYYDGKWDDGCNDRMEDDHSDCVDPCVDPCDTYDPCDPCDKPCPIPPIPYPPPGIFPPNTTWPPYREDKTRPDDRPWDDQWDDYHNDGGDYGREYGEEDCDHYKGGYDDGYDHYGDHGRDHYREWDKKHHDHGYVDDHDEHEDYDDQYGHKDDYGGDEFNYGDQEPDYYDDDQDYHGDWDKKYHDHHGYVDDHEKDKYEDHYGGDESNYGDQDDDYDEGNNHGYVDDWDDEGNR
ncbi:paf acetylhydrolase family protein [Diaporthe amygdali]|uniref:paf acetylhydrolase family protein n=1 Tax=Phomopsis amygdali TaxID=1214568 RepID=UPI0022FE0BED|nr:paf acetylhydrolase family protein [Diaporthe amygdali]KAJ0117231.1 paf acetylhydrolase family protein [Diaporthe amygdali]